MTPKQKISNDLREQKRKDKQTKAKFKKVTDAYWVYYGDANLIGLNGKFCSDELREIARVMDGIHKERIFQKELTQLKESIE